MHAITSTGTFTTSLTSSNNTRKRSRPISTGPSKKGTDQNRRRSLPFIVLTADDAGTGTVINSSIISIMYTRDTCRRLRVTPHIQKVLPPETAGEEKTGGVTTGGYRYPGPGSGGYFWGDQGGRPATKAAKRL